LEPGVGHLSMERKISSIRFRSNFVPFRIWRDVSVQPMFNVAFGVMQRKHPGILVIVHAQITA
jgi:hypothetical protein